LKGENYHVAHGGSRNIINGHMKVADPKLHAWRGQLWGLDIVKLYPAGNRARGFFPKDLNDYAIFGEPVYAPCTGQVLAVENNLPDLIPPESDTVNKAGNYVLLRCGENTAVLLAHFKQGSVTVQPEQMVAVGDRLGAIGNSGNTSEPHLHISAQYGAGSQTILDADPRPIVFSGRWLVRNDRVPNITLPFRQPASASGEILRFEANPESGFSWPYYLYIPDRARTASRDGEKITLLVFPNNTGQPSDDFQVHDEAAREKVEQFVDFPHKLGTPMLVPVFPRPWNIYTHALDRATMQTQIPNLKRLDLQLIAMIDDASRRFVEEGARVDERVLIMGFSASGMTANRFTLLHPQRVRGAAVGSPGGWPIIPIESWKGNTLDYPIGTANVEQLTGQPFNLEVYKSIPQLFYLGDQDHDDAVAEEDRDLVHSLFGQTQRERWSAAEEVYRHVGINAEFRLYPGTGHEISSEMWRDTIRFLNEALQ
jgi:hypothetical protein